MVDPSRVRAQATVRDFEEWARYLRVQPERLREAVRAVGITPRKIRQYFREAPSDHPPDRLGDLLHGRTVEQLFTDAVGRNA